MDIFYKEVHEMISIFVLLSLKKDSFVLLSLFLIQFNLLLSY